VLSYETDIFFLNFLKMLDSNYRSKAEVFTIQTLSKRLDSYTKNIGRKSRLPFPCGSTKCKKTTSIAIISTMKKSQKRLICFSVRMPAD
jgi:hypothetical protein